MTEDEKFLRTDEYGISLIGKKISIGMAAGAIVVAADYIPATTATAIIKAALKIIGGGVAAAVGMLPDYLYVTSNVYKKKSVGKTYYRYYNDFGVFIFSCLRQETCTPSFATKRNDEQETAAVLEMGAAVFSSYFL